MVAYIWLATDVGEWWLKEGAALKLHRAFLFLGFHGFNAGVAVYIGELYNSLPCSINFHKYFL
jgi:hypothetical protein